MKKLLNRPEALLVSMGLIFLSITILVSCFYLYIPKSKDVIYVTKEEKEILLQKGEADSVLINLNTASLEELCALEGISTVTASAIIEYRTKNGRFESTEELKNIKGIGEVKYKNISPYVVTE